MAKQKLELTWMEKKSNVNIEPRILIHHEDKDYGEKDTQNMIIHGDNLLALKALEKDYTNRIKCIYIDPPYNTGSAFEHYDDNLEHSQWLSLMMPRLQLLRNLLREDGSIWISIDDDEYAYLKVLCDEVFGRFNFINTVIWEKKFAPQNSAKFLSDNHDYIMIYAKDKAKFKINLLPRSAEMNARYKNLDNDPRGVWQSDNLLRKDAQRSGLFEITTPNGTVYSPPSGRSWRVSQSKFEEMVKDNRIWFGASGGNVPRIKRFLSEVQDGARPVTIWKHTEVGNTQEASQENRKLSGTYEPFATPKPERLIERVLTLATDEGDLVLDSFLGSGTTTAVAQKMGRNYIGIELGDHCYTHVLPRMQQVIDGEQGGISKERNWQGGGGYRFYELAPSLIEADQWGQPVISKQYDANMLAAAVAKHEGYSFNPDPSMFWKQSQSTEKSYLFVTDRFVDAALLQQIHDMMGEDEVLLISCSSFESGLQNMFSNIYIKKIPDSLLTQCEFGVDNYALNIVNPPVYEEDDDMWEEE